MKQQPLTAIIEREDGGFVGDQQVVEGFGRSFRKIRRQLGDDVIASGGLAY